jgi:hypothetical protein
VKEEPNVKQGWKTTEFWTTVGVNLWAMFGGMLPPAAQATVVAVATGAYGIARAVTKFGAQPPPTP